MFDLSKFISEYVTKRPVSMFYNDIQNNRDILTEKIEGKKVLVIGGAGSIGSSFIKVILPFRTAMLVVVDINEKGWVSTGGAYINKLEEQMAEFLHVERVAVCQSGTAGLHLALMECGVMPGDMVIVPTYLVRTILPENMKECLRVLLAILEHFRIMVIKSLQLVAAVQ